MVMYIIFGHNGILKYKELTSIRENYELRIKDMDRRLNELETELELAKKDRAYLENVIRRELGFQKEGEDLYILRSKVNDNKSGTK